MKPAPFEYLAPESLEEALNLMDEHGFDAKLLAGGQSLVPVMNFRLSQPSLIIDLNNIPNLNQCRRNGDGSLRIDAMVRHSQLERNPLVAENAPLLSETMPFIAHPQIRNRGTIGGSLAHADPAAELPAIMVALQARFRLQKLGGKRWVNAEDFYEALFTTALEPEEILTEIAIPPLPPDTGCAFMELARRHGDFALVGVAAMVGLDDDGRCRQARLVYLNVGEIPTIAHQAAATLIGSKPSSDLIETAAQHAAQHEIEPTGDIHASADYKRHLAYALGKRAIQKAVQRAAHPQESNPS
ncbi:MAG: xanthine dehydrogenase family protein subunit M [Chloroflexi bacterium]|nr:xanthine dehydrogenase family protein subunit M [Chloroflexota bacterium]